MAFVEQFNIVNQLTSVQCAHKAILDLFFIPTSASVRSFSDLINIKDKLNSFRVPNLAEHIPICSHTNYRSINIAILRLHVEPSLVGLSPFS
jgi:hypothetical protein